MRTQHFAQGGVQQVGGGMVAAGMVATRTIDLRGKTIADADASVAHTSDVRGRGAPLARVVDRESGMVTGEVSGVADLKKTFDAARQRRRMGKGTLLFVDEIHRFNRSQQDSFLPVMEDGTVVLVGATTENPSFELNAALLSRARVLTFKSLDEEAIDHYFHFLWVPEPRTPLADVRKLDAGHRMVVETAPWRVRISRWWNPEDAPPLERDPAATVRAMFEEVAPLVVRSDVPVGVALSGKGDVVREQLERDDREHRAQDVGGVRHPEDLLREALDLRHVRDRHDPRDGREYRFSGDEGPTS